MKDISQLSNDLMIIENKLRQNLLKTTQKTIEQIHNDVLTKAPSNTGEYASSIKIKNATFEENKIKARVFTDLKSEDGYYIGRMIENGTGIYALEPHIGHTKTFIASGYQFWYVPVKSVKRPIGQKININGTEFYIAKSQPAKPHFKPSLDQNEITFKQNINKAIKESFNL